MKFQIISSIALISTSVLALPQNTPPATDTLTHTTTPPTEQGNYSCREFVFSNPLIFFIHRCRVTSKR